MEGESEAAVNEECFNINSLGVAEILRSNPVFVLPVDVQLSKARYLCLKLAPDDRDSEIAP